MRSVRYARRDELLMTLPEADGEEEHEVGDDEVGDDGSEEEEAGEPEEE